MAFSFSRLSFPPVAIIGIFLLSILLFGDIRPIRADNETYVQTVNADNKVVYLLENRQPALYTQSFGDCLGGSLLDITRFDAAYYQDNMTVAFHLEGTTKLTNESIMSEWILWISSNVVLMAGSVHWCLGLWRKSI